MIHWDDLTRRLLREAIVDTLGSPPGLDVRDDTVLADIGIDSERRGAVLTRTGRRLFAGFSPEVDLAVPGTLKSILRFGKLGARASIAYETLLWIACFGIASAPVQGNQVPEDPLDFVDAPARTNYARAVAEGFAQRTSLGSLAAADVDKIAAAQTFGAVAKLLLEEAKKRLGAKGW